MIVKATRPSILRVGFDPEAFASLRTDEKEHVVYHLMRIFSGEASAVFEWDHLGMKVNLAPWKQTEPSH